MYQEVGCPTHSSLNEGVSKRQTGLPSEEMFQMGVAQFEAARQILDGAWRFGLDDLEDLADVIFLNRGRDVY